MDCKVLTRGSVIYIPVQVPGGLVTAGDIHAYQGDGEIVCGLETAGEILLKLEVVKGVEESWPIIETADRWYTVASRETMEEASHSAVQAMMDFIRMRTKRYSNYEIMILLSQFADIQVCQIVDPLVTMRFGVERRVIEEVEFAQPAKEP